ncbi:hypothetical protein FRIGORI9N_270058 [Frigoribacterium sp. 9N]|nr:hypothetical protein FRIGORI9N_270058 [Frigoribacterium sp. 9N]
MPTVRHAHRARGLHEPVESLLPPLPASAHALNPDGRGRPPPRSAGPPPLSLSAGHHPSRVPRRRGACT